MNNIETMGVTSSDSTGIVVPEVNTIFEVIDIDIDHIIDDDEDLMEMEVGMADDNALINPETGEMEMRDLEKESELKNSLRQIGRAELEDIVIKKIVECVNTQTSLGRMHAKYLHLNGFKDKLLHKADLLQKQVSVLSETLKEYAENASKSPSEQKPLKPVTFYRSVGLQVNLSTSTKEPLRRMNNTPGILNSNASDLSKVLEPHDENVSKSSSSQTTLPPVKFNAPAGHQTNVTNIKAQEMSLTQEMSNGRQAVTPPNTHKSNNNNNNDDTVMSPRSGIEIVNEPTVTVGEPRNEVSRPESVPPEVVRRSSSNNALTPPPAQHQQVIIPTNPGVRAAVQTLNSAVAAPSGQTAILNNNGIKYRMPLVSNSAGCNLVSPQGWFHSVTFPGRGRLILPTGLTQGHTPTGFRPSVIQRQQQHQYQQRQQEQQQWNNYVAATNVPILNGNPQLGLGKFPQRPLQFIRPKTFPVPALPAPTTQIIPQCYLTKDKPPRPELTIQEEQDGRIALSWTHQIGQNDERIRSYQIFACLQPLNPTEANFAPPWKPVGDSVKALPLPMTCTLSQFDDDKRYHFIVRGVDVYNRSGPFSEISSIVPQKKD